jgi:Circadian oscillating protein COP23
MQPHSINLIKIFFIAHLSAISALIVIPQSAVRSEHSYSFACNSIKSSRKVIPTTVILFSNRTSSPLIRWESGLISNPQQRCLEVSRKFDDFSRRGKLHFLNFTTNKKSNRTIICGLSKQDRDRACDDSNKLFELSKAIKDPQQVLNGLRHNLVTIDSDGGILQNSDDEYTQIVDLQASIEQRETALPSGYR